MNLLIKYNKVSKLSPALPRPGVPEAWHQLLRVRHARAPACEERASETRGQLSVAEAGRRSCRRTARPDLVCFAESQGVSAPRLGACALFAVQSADGPPLTATLDSLRSPHMPASARKGPTESGGGSSCVARRSSVRRCPPRAGVERRDAPHAPSSLSRCPTCGRAPTRRRPRAVAPTPTPAPAPARTPTPTPCRLHLYPHLPLNSRGAEHCSGAPNLALSC